MWYLVWMGQRLTSLHTHIAWDMDDGGYTTQAEQDGPYGSNDWHCKCSRSKSTCSLFRACDHFLFVQATPLTGMTHGQTCTTGAASIGIGFTKCTGDKTQKRKTNIFCELVVPKGRHDIRWYFDITVFPRAGLRELACSVQAECPNVPAPAHAHDLIHENTHYHNTRNRIRGGISMRGLVLVFRAVSMYRRERGMILPGGMHTCRLKRPL